MLRNVSLEEISDGRLYGLNDMAKLGCNDCVGCSSCCRGMGNTIVLDPYDVWRLTGGLGVSLQQLLAGHLELNVVDGIILPNLKLAGESEQCTFLNESGRCSIHPYRPGTFIFDTVFHCRDCSTMRRKQNHLILQFWILI